ncbi:hypothetical protein [Neomegalonema sp.]|uniref:hypothetical protein n=1 Tax=Neomegalonema sp. TaxID=2039713 RepID=UPI00260985C7|nr:hypothetical protein [Neomegalonema sp.]MDD2870204.1 hypothetical protein [Neomegalonema sp.]
MTDPNRDHPPESAPQRHFAHEEPGVAPDAAALALRDMAQRLKRTEERSEKAFGAVGDNLRRILARLDEVERKMEAGSGSAGAGSSEASAAQTSRIDALAQRFEDMSDALAAASGDIESLRRRLEQGAPAPAAPPEGVPGAPPPNAELMRALNARLEQTRAEAARAGGSAERAAREALAQAGESSRRADEVSAKLSRALASVTARVDAFEKRAQSAPPPSVSPALAALANPALEPGVEAPGDYGHKDVAPYVARVERELDAAASRGSNFFDRIAAAAEARVNVGRMPRAKDAESYVTDRAPSAPEPPPYAPPPRAEPRMDPRVAVAAAAAYAETPPVREPQARLRDPEPEAAPQAAPALEDEEEVYGAGDLAVVPGRKARSANGRAAANPRNEFDAAFAEEEEAPADVSVGDLRSRLRGAAAAPPAAAEAADDKGRARRKGKAARPARAVEAEEEEKAPARRGGLLGFLKRGKGKVEEDLDEEGEEPAPRGRKGAKPAPAPVGKRSRSAEKAALEAFEEDLDEEEEDWEDEVSRGRGRRLLILVALAVLAAVAGFALMKMRGGA